MKILLTAIGSHGDVHPMLGLASELQRRGHQVVFACSPHFAPLVRGAGLELIEVGTVAQFEALTCDPQIWHPTKGVQTVLSAVAQWALRPGFEMIRQQYVPGETVVVASALDFGARVAQDALGVPTVTVQLAPASFRSTHRPAVLPPSLSGRWVPGWLTRLQYQLADAWYIDPVIAGPINKLRGELGLAAIDRPLDTWWHSPERVLALFPDWYAPAPPDWPPQTVLTHFPLWDETGVTEIDPQAAEFLSNGPPPIAFTPGSAMRQGQAFFRAAAQACRRMGWRGILLTRYAEQIPDQLPEEVRHFEFVPFRYLLPRCAALVHHGGIGSLSQALAAGIPQLIMPMGFDQHDNAARVRRLGVGSSVGVRQFRSAMVARRLIHLVTSPEVHRCCRQVAERFQGLDGIRLTCDEIEQLIQHSVVPKSSC